MSDIPDTDMFQVAQVAVAWEITKRSLKVATDAFKKLPTGERLKLLTNTFIQIHSAVTAQQPIEN